MSKAAPAVPALLLALLGLLNAFGSDLYIPALPALRADLDVSPWQAQQTVSLFFFASAFMSLWYGAISDTVGRRATIIGSLLLFTISSAACLLPLDITALWVLRIVQGVAAGAGLVVSRTIVHDIHAGLMAQRLLSRMMVVQTLSLILMPVLGAWLTHWFGWRAVFAVTAVITSTLALAAWRWLPETRPPIARRSFHPGRLWPAYRAVLGTPSFLRLTAAHVANWTSMVIYIVSAPAFVIHLLGRPATDIFLVYLPITIGLIAGFWSFPEVQRRLGGTLRPAYALLALAVALNVGAAQLFPASLLHLVPLALYACGMALALAPLINGAVQAHSERAGIATSCQTFLQFAMMAVGAGLIAPLLWHSLLLLAAGTGSLTLAGGLCVYAEARRKRNECLR